MIVIMVTGQYNQFEANYGDALGAEATLTSRQAHSRPRLLLKSLEEMMIIKCKECGKEISDKAGACPACGANRSSNSVLRVLLLVAGLSAAAIGYGLLGPAGLIAPGIFVLLVAVAR